MPYIARPDRTQLSRAKPHRAGTRKLDSSQTPCCEFNWQIKAAQIMARAGESIVQRARDLAGEGDDF